MSFFDTLSKYVNGARILRDWLGSGGVPVSKELAQSRANVCLMCPLNKHGIELTEMASEAIREQIGVKNHLQLHVDGENDLFTCEVCSCPLKLKVFVPFRLVKPLPEEKDKYPGVCWLRTENHDSIPPI